MDKRELIEHIDNILFDNLKDTLFTEPTFSITESAKDNKVAITFETKQGGALLGGMLKKFEKVTVPQFVAEYIEKSRLKGWDLLASMCFIVNAQNKEVIKWFYLGENKNIFALAWINGYTVEQEKRYRVKIKNAYYNKYPQFLCETDNGIFWAAEIDLRKTKFTRKELEQAGFGWVFSCEGVEVEEVE